MLRWKSRSVALLAGFAVGLALVLLYQWVAALYLHEDQGVGPASDREAGCAPGEFFRSPEEVLAALTSDNSGIRREVYRKIRLRPGLSTTYYDYERDEEYPERVDRALLRYVHLDDSSDPQAVITFVRLRSPAALILRRDACGWRLIGALTSWLRFEDYPYADWLELPEAVRPGVHEILVRESSGDATRYERRARLLKMKEDRLEEVAEFAEESIEPLEGYDRSDWTDVKRRQIETPVFLPAHDGQMARLRLECSDEVVRYSGSVPRYSYWLETDGAWHVASRHWRERPATRLTLRDRHIEELVWNGERKKFIAG